MTSTTPVLVRPGDSGEGARARAMPSPARVLIGWLWLPVTGSLSLLGLLWIYAHAERARPDGPAVPVHWWGPDFHVTLTTATLLTMAFAGLAGSVVQSCIVFSMRAGSGTLEHGYEAWYFLRPLVSALLAVLVGVAVTAGLVVVTQDTGAGTPGLSLPTMVAIGALAGLFTDQVLQRMQRILGATDPKRLGSDQPTPGASDSDGNIDHVATGPDAVLLAVTVHDLRAGQP